MAQDQEEELRKIYSEAQVLQSYLEELKTRYQLLLATVSDMEAVKLAITELSRVERGHEVLVDLGGGVLTKAAIVDNSKVFVNVGSGVLVDKSLEDAIKTIDQRIAGLNKTIDSLQENIRRLEGEVGVRRTRISELTRSMASKA
jgi:prefoldin alpha subunit